MPKKSATKSAVSASAPPAIRPIKKLMVANRSEIAIRVMRL